MRFARPISSAHYHNRLGRIPSHFGKCSPLVHVNQRLLMDHPCAGLGTNQQSIAGIHNQFLNPFATDFNTLRPWQTVDVQPRLDSLWMAILFVITSFFRRYIDNNCQALFRFISSNVNLAPIAPIARDQIRLG